MHAHESLMTVAQCYYDPSSAGFRAACCSAPDPFFFFFPPLCHRRQRECFTFATFMFSGNMYLTHDTHALQLEDPICPFKPPCTVCTLFVISIRDEHLFVAGVLFWFFLAFKIFTAEQTEGELM